MRERQCRAPERKWIGQKPNLFYTYFEYMFSFFYGNVNEYLIFIVELPAKKRSTVVTRAYTTSIYCLRVKKKKKLHLFFYRVDFATVSQHLHGVNVY